MYETDYEDIDYMSLPPDEQKALAIDIYIDSRVNPDKKPLRQIDVAAMFGHKQKWLSSALADSGILERFERRTRSNVIIARAMANKAAPEIMQKTIESARKARGNKFEYITQQDRRDVLDRAGVRAEKEDAQAVTVTFAGGGFDIGMPEGK